MEAKSCHTNNALRGIYFSVKYFEGIENLLLNNLQTAIDTLNINYTYKKSGTPSEIKLTYKILQNGNYLITATVVDKEKLRCLDYSKRIYFSLDGSGKLLENLGTPTGSSIIEAANGQAQIEFKPDRNKKAVIEVRNQDFKGSYLVIENEE